MTGKEKADKLKLREIAAKLSVWRKFGLEDGWHSKRTYNAALEALKLLRDNVNLLHHCRNTYVIENWQFEVALKHLDDILESMQFIIELPPESIIDYVGWYEYFPQEYFINELNRLADEIDKSKGRRRSKLEKTSVITAYLQNYPWAKSSDIEKATGIHESDVRHIWGPIKKALQEKTFKSSGYKKNGKVEAMDISASCGICSAPLSQPFECSVCKEIIVGECKTCHYTNYHLEQASP